MIYLDKIALPKFQIFVKKQHGRRWMMAKEGNKTEVVILIIRKKNMANFISHIAAELRERESQKRVQFGISFPITHCGVCVALCCVSTRVLIDRFV